MLSDEQEMETRRRNSLRLNDYDYSAPGAYFVTMCTKDRANIFGSVRDGEMHLNQFGQVVEECWNDLVNHYPTIELDAFVVMPNHVHAIIMIMDEPTVGATSRRPMVESVEEGLRPSPTGVKRHGLPEIVRAFKSFSARRINEIRHTPGAPVWQRNYFDHIIRDDKSLNTIREYILSNPQRWSSDNENVDRKTNDKFDLRVTLVHKKQPGIHTNDRSNGLTD